jgi:hypothetical protein
MRAHNGMRPQDVPILLKIIAKGHNEWLNKDLAAELFLSSSEISESLNRSLIAGLVNNEKKKVHKQSLLEFIEYGIKYTFPTLPGSIVNGLPTAHSHPLLQNTFSSENLFVWPDVFGEKMGQAIEPLLKSAPKASQLDNRFYGLLALTDVFRVGKSREKKVALEVIKKEFL